MLALVVLGGWSYGNARYDAGKLEAQLADTKDTAKADKANDQRVTDAVSSYADRAAALQPIVVHSHNSEVRYAESPAGSVRCRDPDRVREIDALDQALFPASTSGSAQAVSADAVTAPGGR